ncbi:hypothetical protein D3C75_640950 [compost metagenome]
MQREAFEKPENLATASTVGRWNGEENFLRARVVDHLLNMLGLVHLQSGDHPVGNPAIVIDKRHRTHGAPHPQGSNQLVTGCPRTVNGDFRQAIVPIGKRDMLGRTEPVAQEVLTHGQAKPADHDQTQPPVVENDGAWDDVLVIAVPINNYTKNQRRQADRLDDRDQRIVAEVAHNRTVHAKANEKRNSNHRSANK